MKSETKNVRQPQHSLKHPNQQPESLHTRGSFLRTINACNFLLREKRSTQRKTAATFPILTSGQIDSRIFTSVHNFTSCKYMQRRDGADCVQISDDEIFFER